MNGPYVVSKPRKEPDYPMRYYAHVIPIAFIMTTLSGCSNLPKDTQTVSESLKMEALRELRDNLRAQKKWEKVHAAEYLLWLGFPEGVLEEYRNEETMFETESPTR